MSLKEALTSELYDLNVRGLVIDKDEKYHGDDATKVSFTMTNPVGLDTGDLTFEFTYVNKLGLSHEAVSRLVRTNAEKQARAFLFDREVEK